MSCSRSSRLKRFPRRFTGGAVGAEMGHLIDPVLDVFTHMRLIPEDFAVKAILLDVLHAGFHLALALRVIAFTGMDAEPGCGGIRVEALVESQFPVLLVDDDQLGLIINALLRQAAEVAQGLNALALTRQCK